MKKAVKFNIGDKVFAKVKGYPAWPAIILEDQKAKYNVKFYGTGETAVVKAKDLFYYLKYKKSLLKPLKRKDYNDAIEDIEKAIEEAGTDGNTVSSATQNDTSPSDLTDAADSKTKKRKRSVTNDKSNNSQPKKRASSAADTTQDSEDSEMEECDNTLEESVDSNVNSTIESEENGKSTKTKKTTKTKEKNLVYDELGEEELKNIKIIPVDFLKAIISYAEHVRKNKSEYQEKPVEHRSKTKEVVIAKIKGVEEYVGIKFNQDNPPDFKNEFERAEYDETEVKRVLAIKSDIEKGTSKPADVPELLEENFVLTESKVEQYVESDLIDRKKAKLKWLTKESSLIELDAKIKACLGLDKAEPKAALEHLSTMAKLVVDPLMIKKHPHVVDMVKRLRRYIGNVKEWNMSEEEKDKFEVEASSVRNKADEVFNNFAKLFNVEDPALFWDLFATEVDKFKQHCKDLKESHVFALTAEPNSRQAFFDRIDDEEEMQMIVSKLQKNDKIQKENSNQVAESDTEQNNK